MNRSSRPTGATGATGASKRLRTRARPQPGRVQSKIRPDRPDRPGRPGRSELGRGVEVLAFSAFADGSGAVAKISWEGYDFLFSHPGEPRCGLVRSPPGGGTVVSSRVARGICLHAFLVLLHEAVDLDWRQRNVRLNAR